MDEWMIFLVAIFAAARQNHMPGMPSMHTSAVCWFEEFV